MSTIEGKIELVTNLRTFHNLLERNLESKVEE